MVDLPKSLLLDTNLVYLLTGPSGSGKTLTLKLLCQLLDVQSNDNHFPVDLEEPLIEQWKIAPQLAIARLGTVGLADPFTWLRTYDQLSVGQRCRFDLTRQFFDNPDHIIVDEWLNTIDDQTARAVAWSTHRLLDRNGRGAIFATTRNNLAADLQPDVEIKCNWTPEPEVILKTSTIACSTIVSELQYRPGSSTDWKALKHLHYAAGNPATIHSYHVAHLPGDGSPAAIVVVSYPDMHSSARNLATDDRYKIGGRRDQAQKLSREVLKMSRIVVTPELRGIGVASWLIARVIEKLQCRYIECVTAMGLYTTFLQTLGFREIPQTTSTAEAELLDLAGQINVPATTSLDPEELARFIDGQSVRMRRKFRRAVWQYYHQYVLHRRTGKKVPKRIAHDTDPRWPKAWELVTTRLDGRPAYFILGPLDPMTGIVEEPEPQG